MQKKETKKEKIARANKVLNTLKNVYGEVVCTLDERFDPWRLLVCAILAAQCTDERVNLVSPNLFARYPTVRDFANSSSNEIEPYISTCGLFRNKAKFIYEAAKYVQDKYAGVVPDEMKELLLIPGVGRKIANLLLGECFAKPGLVVDTHCGRLARRLGFTKNKLASSIEKDLTPLLNKDNWREWGLYMVSHGRKICKARKPLCEICEIADLCPKIID